LNPYIAISKNFKVKSAKKLKAVPYLGDNSDYSFLGGYEDVVTTKIGNGIDETSFVKLVEDFADDDFPFDDLELFEAFKSVISTKMTSRDLRIKYRELRTPPKFHPSIDSAEADNLSGEETVKTFMKCFCRRCLIYGCEIHKKPSKPVANPHKLFYNPVKVEKGVTCGKHCYKIIENGDINEETVEENACALAPDEVWTGSDQSFFRILRFSHVKNFCGIAQVMQTKTCKQVFEFSKMEPEETFPDDEEPSSLRKRKRVVINQTHVESGKTSYYYACDCKGKCSDDCKCVKKNNYCEKFCGCSSDSCSNRFDYCKCKASCGTVQCSCFKANRECDPDKCNCNVKAKEETVCKNAGLQRKEKKHLLLAESEVSGWGMFTKDDIEKGELISEYCGELISEKEGERRGKIYDAMSRSYLFSLTKEFDVDAARKGNKIRFANNSDKPNCEIKLMNVIGDKKIGVYADKKIKAGEELFIDYGYSPNAKSMHFKKKGK
jgi:[histone H3]-lysine27 N-trimethyltransferase EZH2